MLIVDGSNLAYRNFNVFEHLMNKHGYQTGMVYGFFNSLLPFSINYNQIIIAWEGQNNWRNSIYPEYKRNRKEKEPEKIQALKDVQELCDLIGLVQIRKSGFEADDVIAYLVKKFKKNIRIFSGDKDLLQLIDDGNNIGVIRPHPKHGLLEYTEKTVKEMLGIPKQYISLFLSIVGDDNVKGVERWGKTTASKIINNEDDPIEFIKHTFPEKYLIVKRNLELIDLLKPKLEIESLSLNDITLLKPDMYNLNKKLDEYEITAYSSKSLIESLYNLEFQNQCKSILISL